MLEKYLHKIRGMFHKEHPKQNDPYDIDKYLDDVASILKVEVPTIYPFPYLVDDGKQVMARDTIEDLTLTPSIGLLGAYYSDNSNIIYLATKYPYGDIPRDLTGPELLFVLVHELRHVWQKQYYPKKYYKRNAIRLETISDIAEIDADAFALAYIQSDRTPFTSKDLPKTMRELHLYGQLDRGKRKNRCKVLAKEYALRKKQTFIDSEG